MVLPIPRGPANRYAWAIRPEPSAFRSVRVIASCPTTASNACGRHFRARTWYVIKDDQVAVHPPPNGPYCDLSTEPAPVRYSHGTREGRLTVAPFRAWRGSTILVAWGPTFNAAP